jgi:hypothetical protein
MVRCICTAIMVAIPLFPIYIYIYIERGHMAPGLHVARSFQKITNII